jgi:hypothetical protein
MEGFHGGVSYFNDSMVGGRMHKTKVGNWEFEYDDRPQNLMCCGRCRKIFIALPGQPCPICTGDPNVKEFKLDILVYCVLAAASVYFGGMIIINLILFFSEGG